MADQESTAAEVQETQTDTTDASTSTDQPTQESTASEQPSQVGGSDEAPSFIDNFDPKSLPDDLVPAYKQMQAAFTKKTQAIAEERRSFESIKRNSDAYNVLMGNDDVKKHILGILAGKQPEQQAPPEDLTKVNINEMSDQQLLEHQKKMMEQTAEGLVKERLAEIEPVQRQLLNNGIRSTLLTIRNAMQDKYADFGQYEQQITNSLGMVNPASGNPVFVDLYLQSPASANEPNPLEAAIEGEYKKLAFDALQSNIDKRANEKVQAKKKANLTQSTNTVKTTEKAPSTEGKPLFDIARNAWRKGMKEMGIESFEESQR